MHTDYLIGVSCPKLALKDVRKEKLLTYNSFNAQFSKLAYQEVQHLWQQVVSNGSMLKKASDS